ncbi:MAG: LPS-assembly protein LptD [Alphaproteobacteria bacterium]|nr:MAG: LPS-assembly protein LptD [Alphaproteobacteria bacterium]
MVAAVIRMPTRMRKRALRLALALVLWASSSITAATAQDAARDQPALISADEITYDENLNVVRAAGHVEISYGERVLLADSISYNTRTEVVTASGNVSVLEPSGDVIFADYVELTGDLREGFIRDIRILMSDRSRLAAASALRTGGNKTALSKAVFSPCELCREDPTRAPLWQIKAAKVEHDQEAQVIRYRDAWMEIFGVPVLYTPYFQHPDPTVKRQTGFLAPTIGSSEILGLTYQQPFFWDLGLDRDLTVAPIITAKQGVVLTGEYRQLFPNGQMNLRGSVTKADRERADGTIENNALRGHVDSTLRFDIDSTWRWGADIQRASDDTYLRIYNFTEDRTLTSRLFAEGLSGRNYLVANGYLFQGLRAQDDDGESPIVLPLIEYAYVGEPDVGGGHFTFDGSLMALTRREGRDSRRLSAALGWELPYVSPAGDIYQLTARLQADGYWVNGLGANSNDINPAGPTQSELTGRIFPQLALAWRYPWARSDGTIHQVIQPMVQTILAPNGSNPDEIPNEDSLDFEFDDTNLFSLNRFPGIDRVDSGSRIDYGLKWDVLGRSGGHASVFAGQSYRFSESSVTPDNSGLQGNFSDIVGRVEVQPTYQLDLLYRFRLDKDTLAPRRNEVDLVAGPPALNLNLSYLSIDSGIAEEGFDDREEISWTLRSRFTRYWSGFASQRIDLKASDTRQVRLGLTYQDECFLIQTVAERNFFEDRDIEPENAFFINIVFKHLGGVTTSTTPIN